MKYRTIVIDPPWQLDSLPVKFGESRGSHIPKWEERYETMSDEEIRNFPINDFADENCDLFLWVTHRTLPLGLDIIKSWGFKYHLLITWDKERGLVRFGFHRRTEFAIYAYRGKMGLEQTGKSMNTIIRVLYTKHSEKPNLFYTILARHTKEPRIDIFARKRHEGFEPWGKEVDLALVTLGAFIIDK